MARFDIYNPKEWDELAWQSRFSASVLSQKLQISPRQLRRYTQRIFGLSSQEWLNQQRLNVAGPLLRQTRSAKRVAFELGFKQLAHFSRAFKVHYGIPPRQFLQLSDEQLRRSQAGAPPQRLPGDRPMSLLDKKCPPEITPGGWPLRPTR